MGIAKAGHANDAAAIPAFSNGFRTKGTLEGSIAVASGFNGIIEQIYISLMFTG